MAAHRRALLDLAGQLAALHDVLACDGMAQDAVETEIEQVEGPLAYRVAVANIDRLALAAKRAADALPPAQSRPEVHLAVATLLHLAALNGDPRPSGYEQGDFVQAALAVLADAGVHVTADAVRKALARAWHTFDPSYPPPGVAGLLAEIERAG